MKQFLILLSGITTLTISNNTFVNFNQNTTFTNNLQTNNNNDNQTSLINNQYGYLNIGDWITNQSIIDHKFYSYDTLALKNYTFANARNTFLVDTTGKLIYNPKVTIPDKDKSDIENTKQEMISQCKINTIKDEYNPYSKSEYSNTYFSGDNTDWQYLQFGGVEKHIDISKQLGGDKVENSNSLSETLGLYYIAKAARENKISQVIANNLGTYFMNQISIKNNFNKDLTNIIINASIKNDNIFNFIYNLPFNISDKNYSLNYIFDSSNKLVRIYYTTWDKKNINLNINYSKSDWLSGNNRSHYVSDNFKLLKWIDYVKTWDDFCIIKPKITFPNSEIAIKTENGPSNNNNLTLNTNQINTSTPNYNITGDGGDIWLENNTFNFNLFSNYNGFMTHQEIHLYFCIWHDNTNIYWNWVYANNANWCSEGSTYSIILKKCNIISCYN